MGITVTGATDWATDTITFTWSREALESFVALLNQNHVVNKYGERITFRLDEYGKGEVSLTGFLTNEEPHDA